MLRAELSVEALASEPKEAHLWCLRPEEIDDPAVLRSCERLLSQDERSQHARFRFAEGRHQYLLTRALVRSLLSQYADVAPDRWRFERDRYGRPDIAEPLIPIPLAFNVSHTS